MEDKTKKQAQFIELRGMGNSFSRIAEELKVSKSTLIEWSKLFRQDVDNYSAMERDAILEKHKISVRHQIELYGEQLSRIREELSKRKLEDVSTEKLLNMELKLMAELRGTGQEIVFSDVESDFCFDITKDIQWKA